MAANQNFPVNTQSPVTSAYVTSSTVPAASSNQRYKVKAAIITGVLQIVCAGLSGISGVLPLVLRGPYFPAVIGWPIWGAVFVSGTKS